MAKRSETDGIHYPVRDVLSHLGQRDYPQNVSCGLQTPPRLVSAFYRTTSSIFSTSQTLIGYVSPIGFDLNGFQQVDG